ncbi:unnamed protein product [Fusarium venenatum]|uniref:Uncharacterized protein n=1 Tax=Fusarium venenatum TaxID=56646 RepID=A0A2L2U4T5_9HYPO|nr:uncharacterized protein FVRRES_10332 [Fusarium venenatum]CEI70255.1 unnamed protein product [Fusarium venenatum]
MTETKHALSRAEDIAKVILKDRSVYSWHAGLWTACRESRRVVARHDIDLVRPEEEDTAALMLSSRLGAEQWRQVVPSEDLFCISGSNKKPSDLDWPCLVDESLETPPKNVAFEFDPSWAVALESRPEDPFIWDTPRASFELALLSKLIFDWVLKGRVRCKMGLEKSRSQTYEIRSR